MLKAIEILEASHLLRAIWTDSDASLHRVEWEPGQWHWRDGALNFWARDAQELGDYLAIAYDVPVTVRDMSPALEAFAKTL